MTNDDDKADVIDISAQVMGFEFSDDEGEIIDSLSAENEELRHLLVDMIESVDLLFAYLDMDNWTDKVVTEQVQCIRKYMNESMEVIECN